MIKPQALIETQNEIKAILANRMAQAINAGASKEKLIEATKRNMEWLRGQEVWPGVSMLDILLK